MAVSYVGTFGGGEESSFDNAVSFTTTRTIEAGEHPVIIVYVGSSSPNVSAVTVGGLGLSLDYRPGTGPIEFWSARASAQISSGATVTVTFDDTFDVKTVVGEVLAGVASSSWVRATASDLSGGGNATIGTTDGTPLIGDLSLGAVMSFGAASTLGAPSNGYTKGGDDGTNPWGFGFDGPLQAIYKALLADGSTTSVVALTGSSGYHGAQVVYVADPGGPPQQLRPDADVTTTGWTTTPLWSKIEEASADGTVITATAS